MRHINPATISAAVALFVGMTIAQTPSAVSNVQLKNRPGDPIQIEMASVPLTENGKTISNPTVRLRNIGKIACKAYSIAFIFTSSDGTKSRVGITEDRAAVGPSANRGIQPGQAVDRIASANLPLKSGESITEVAVRLDYAEMADGTRYGPDPDGIGRQFSERRAVVQAERTRLLQLYEQKGADALIKDLQGH